MHNQLGDLPWSRPHADMAADAGGKIPSWFARFLIHTPLFSGDRTDEYKGLGIGPKSATIPVYASECTPPTIRGGLVMMWQMWTAFGIMLGLLFNVAFLHLGDGADMDLCKEKHGSLLAYSCVCARIRTWYERGAN